MDKTTIPMDELIAQLHGSDWTARCDAARLLGQSRDPRAVDALLPDLHDSDWRVRRNAAQALGALRDKRATEALATLLKDRTLTVRQRAIVALGRIKDPQALPALIDILLDGKRESYDASKAIRKFGRKAMPEIARAYETSGNKELLLLLVELKFEGVFDLLVDAFESAEPSRQQMAVREFGNLGDRRAIPHLLKRLSNSDQMMQLDVIQALGKLKATEAIPRLLTLLTDDELYGPQSGLYRTLTSAFQSFGGIVEEVQNAFPGNYPAMFNMGGASISLPEAMGLMGNRSNSLDEMLSRFQTGAPGLEHVPESLRNVVQNAMEETAWKFGVMFADARDAKQERVTRLIELLTSPSSLTRTAAAMSLTWYGDERSLEPLKQLLRDPDETVRIAAVWAVSALERSIGYRDQSCI